jgi:UDP-N-acetyl-D-glucosamine 4,6-dehydratase
MLKPTYTKRVLFFVLADMVLSLLSLYASYALRFNFAVPERFLSTFMYIYPAVTLCRIGSYALFRLYSRSWRYFGLQDLRRLLMAHLLAAGVFVILFIVFEDMFNPVPRSVFVIDFVISMMLTGGFRISRRLFLESSDHSGKKCIVIGATPRGAQIIKSSLLGEISYHPVAVTDDRQRSIGTYVENLKVYDEVKLEEIVEKKGIKAALIAKSMMPSELDRIFERLSGCGVDDIKIVNLVSDRKESLKDIAIEDILARKPKDLDVELIGDFIKGKKILITGAGGSIGSEICRQCQRFGADRLILVEHSEYNLYAIHDELDNWLLVCLISLEVLWPV